MEYKREPLEDNEIVALKQACKSFEEELIINVLLETGMRVAEFSSLKKENISWQRDCITTIGKGNKRRVIPMSQRTRFYLTEYFTQKNEMKFCPRWIQIIVKRIAERACIIKKVSPHVLRHTFAVCYLHRGGNIRALQGILGHSHIQTTDHYLNYSGERVIEDFKKVWGAASMSEESHFLEGKSLFIIAGLFIFSFVVYFLKDMISFFTLKLSTQIFWVSIIIFSLFVLLEIYAVLSRFADIHFKTPINKIKQYTNKIESESKEIERLLNYDLDKEDDKNLYSHWNEMEEAEFSKEALSPYLIQWHNHVNVVNSILERENERQNEKEHVLRVNQLKEEIKQLEEANKKLQQSQEVQKTTEKAKFLQQELDSPFYVYSSDLTEQKIQWLKEEGYQKDHQWDIENKTSIEMMIKPRSNEGLSHAYLVGALQKFIAGELGWDNVKIYETKMPDIVFNARGQEWAIEVETGTLQKKNPKELNEKVEALKKNYEDRWFFVVTNKDLVPKYKELGDTTDRANVTEKLYNIIYPEGAPAPSF